MDGGGVVGWFRVCVAVRDGSGGDESGDGAARSARTRWSVTVSQCGVWFRLFVCWCFMVWLSVVLWKWQRGRGAEQLTRRLTARLVGWLVVD